jgi:hypothetical protein
MQQIDESIIKGLVGYKHINFDDLDWINCNLHNAGRADFKSRVEYDRAIESDDELLFIVLLIYSFERVGFDSKLDKCSHRCDLYSEKNIKIKTHPVSVVSGLNAIRGDGSHNIKALLQSNKIEHLADEWLKEIKKVHQQRFPKKGFNDRGFNAKHSKSFLEFFYNGKIRELRDMLRGNKFDEAYKLLKDNIEGVGPKLAKFITRDLAFSLTGWAKEEKVDPSIPKVVLRHAIPIDRWVRRVSISIPTIGNKVKADLQISDLAEDDITGKIDEKLSSTIAGVCCGMGLNPLRFDFGVYLFGVHEIKRKPPVTEIYKQLKAKWH